MASVKRLLAGLPAFRSLACSFDAGAADVGEVVDRLGRLAALRAEIERIEKPLKAVIVENGQSAVEGRGYRASLSIFEQDRLDTAAIRESQTEAWLKKFTLTSTITKVAVKARIGTGLGEEAA